MGGWERANKYHHYYNLKKINLEKVMKNYLKYLMILEKIV